MTIKRLTNQTTPQTETDNDTVFLLEEGSAIALATGGTAMALNNATDAALHVRGEISSTGGAGVGVIAGVGSTFTKVRVGDTGRIAGGGVAVEFLGGLQKLINNGVVRSLESSSHGVVASGAYDAVINHGRIRGGTTTGASGVILATQAGMMLENDGRIIGSTGVYMVNTSYSEVRNTGRISGSVVGVDVNTALPGNDIHNEGLIAGGVTGIRSQASSLTIFNSGTIRTDAPHTGAAVQGGTGVETILNAGEIVGDVRLGSGDDEFGSTGPGFVNGRVHGDLGNDLLAGAGADDRLFGDGGTDVLLGRGGNDRLNGGADIDQLVGGRGDDILIGDQGGDFLFGEGGNDVLRGGDGVDGLEGGAGRDTLRGGADGDGLQGQGGADRMFGDTGTDTMLGGTGADEMHGGADDDTMVGEGGEDVLHGDDGNDYLVGGAGNDVLRGGTGDDVLVADAGNDRLFGGGGADQFLFLPATGDFDHDQIIGFSDGVDLIDLSVFAIPDMGAYLATALTEVNGNAVLDIGAINPGLYSGDVTLVGVSAAQITALDFV